MVRNSPAMQETRFDPWVGKIAWRRKWQPTPVLLPGKSMDGEAWRAAVHGVTESRTGLSDFTFLFKKNKDKK